MIRSTVLLFLALVALPVDLSAQGFAVFNGRNHPELDWQVVETEHFKIVFPAHLAGIEVHAATIAEATYSALSANLGISFDDPIRIYLSDEDEIVNGFAVPFGAGHTNIWVNVNDAALIWTGEEKWLRKVVSHELAHIFHYKAVRSTIHPFNFAFSNPLPRFWTEGIAQYETEVWDAFRGEQTLRTAVLDDQLSYEDGRSIRNGSLLYAIGNSQVRFFAEQFGDSTLATLLAERQSTLFGLARYHDFDRAFQKTTGESYREFYDRWRRLVNVRYNSIAAVMESADSLGVDPIPLGAQYVYDAVYSADSKSIAAIVVQSLDRPIRQLVVMDVESERKRVLAEDNVRGPLAWSPDGTSIVFVRNARTPNGSLINDLFSVSLPAGRVTRLTTGRRASSPSFSPDGSRLAFVGSEAGTANIFKMDVLSRAVGAVTHFVTDTQIGNLQWQPDRETIAYSIFDADGVRRIDLVDINTGSSTRMTDGAYDDRDPIWSTDGSRLAYTSLRDGVPNVFVCTPPPSTQVGETLAPSCRDHRRVTNLITGGMATDWTAKPDSTSPTGYEDHLTVRVFISKRNDAVYSVPVDRVPYSGRLELADAFTSWTTHRPPHVVPPRIAPDESLIRSEAPYRPLRNLTHVASIVSPYVSTARYGIGGLTIWSEPLAKHMGYLAVGVDVRDPIHESAFQAGYINNQFRPTIQTEVFHLPDSPRPYGTDLLLERLSLITIRPIWHLNTDTPFLSKKVDVKFGFLRVSPRDPPDPSAIDAGLPIPETGQQFSVRMGYTRKRIRPWIDNVVHPLDGSGFRARIGGAAQGLKADQKYVRVDVSAYSVLSSVRNHRFFLYGRAQGQVGESLAQDFLGLSRYDDLQVSAPVYLNYQSNNPDRVRGYRDFSLGKAILFGTVEYRIPITRSLRTLILGVIRLGSTSLSLFADGAIVSPDLDFASTDRRLGLGTELKNAITVGGAFSFMHAIGVAQQSQSIGTDGNWEVYYRIRTTLPF